jgi:hypothetical protein
MDSLRSSSNVWGCRGGAGKAEEGCERQKAQRLVDFILYPMLLQGK